MAPPAKAERDTSGPATARRGKLRPRHRRVVEGLDLKVPVSFNQHLGPRESAFLLIQVLRHVLFIRGQIPMPYQQLVETLEEREERDRLAKERTSTRTVEESGGDEGSARLEGRVGAAGRVKAKSIRPLARATAHRRARKALRALEENTRCIDQAFLDAAEKRRPVREGLILLGASHLSPREIYSVVFPVPLRVTPSDLVDDGNARQGKGKSVADAYSRKLVRCLVSGMSGVTFRGLGPCRVHVFLRVEDSPVHSLSVAPARAPSACADAASAAVDAKEISLESAITASGRHGASASAISPIVDGTPQGGPSAPIVRLAPRPNFKIRISRNRPAPKVSVLISKRVTPSTQGTQTGQGQGRTGGAGSGKSTSLELPGFDSAGVAPGVGETGERSEGLGKRQGVLVRAGGDCKQQGCVWHVVVCPRLAGLKGCDSLAS